MHLEIMGHMLKSGLHPPRGAVRACLAGWAGLAMMVGPKLDVTALFPTTPTCTRVSLSPLPSSDQPLVDRVRTGLGRRVTFVVLVGALTAAAVWTLQRGSSARGPGDPALEAGVAAMGAEGLEVSGEPVLIELEEAGGEVAVVATAHRVGDVLPDLYRVSVDRPPGGVPIRVGGVFNLSESSGASERIERLDGRLLVVSQWQEAGCIGLMLIDFGGEPEALTAAWSRLDRWKVGVTRWQQTGQRSGLGVHHVAFPTALAGASFRRTPEGALEVSSGGRVRWSLSAQEAAGWVVKPSEGGMGEALVQPPTRGSQGHLAWLVDTVRDLSFVGPEKIATLEHVAFDLLDDARRAREDVLGPEAIEEPDLAAGAGEPTVAPTLPPPDALQPVADALPGRLWPPAPATPIVEPPVASEGQWVPLTTFVRPSPDGAPYFLQSWIRPDAERAFARVSVTTWDPERVRLGAVAGTREPIPATGFSGTGQIPRHPGLLPRLVAAFNGGFQTKHGAWGMRVEGRDLVPPAGDGATVATFGDGRTLLGTWPATGPAPDRRALPPGLEVPPSVESLRQNLQPLVADGRLNPSGRRKWGSTAGEHVDDTHTTRTGICLLEGGALAYFFGANVSADTLGAAMLAYHCVYGIHLDMNAGHSGFEFYNVKDEAGEKFEARRMIDKMWHMNFPRYIGRDFRDFFYLTLNPLPAERLGAATGLTWAPVAGEGVLAPTPWTAPARTLEATLTLEGLESPVRLVRLPRAGMTAASTGGEGGVAALRLARSGGDSVQSDALPFSFEGESPRPTQIRPDAPGQGAILLAWDEEDLLLVEVDERSRAKVDDWLEAHGWTQRVALATAGPGALALRFANASGETHVEGSASHRDADVLWLRLPARLPRAGRLEPIFGASSEGGTP